MFKQGKKFVKTIAVTSGKTGVGKTTVTANLAVAMNRLGRKVMIMDSDFGLSTVEVLLHVSPRFNIQQLLNNELSPKDILVEDPQGLSILSAGHGQQERAALTELQQLKLLEVLDACTCDIDVLLVNTASGISGNVAFFCSAAQEIIIVTSPERTSIDDAATLITMLYSRYQEKQFQVLVNSAKSSEDSLEAFRRLSHATEQCQSISLDYLGYLPHDKAVQAAVRAQRAFVDLYPGCPASRGIIEIVEKLLNSGDRIKGTLQFCTGQFLKTSTGLPR